MAVLIRAAITSVAIAIAAVGCYAPDVRDCTVTCTPGTSCADGEVCGSDGFCAAPEVAGTCGSGSATDTVDAGSAAPLSIHIMIASKGKVVLNDTSSCDTIGSDTGDCMFTVPAHAAVSMIAMPTDIGHPFVMWTGMSCMGANATCSFTPTADTTVGAMFR